MKRHKSPEYFLAAHAEYKAELTKLRSLCKSNKSLTETVKWGAPTYVDANNKNVVGLGAFKSYVGLWFFQGSFLKDKANLLMNAQEEALKSNRDELEKIVSFMQERI